MGVGVIQVIPQKTKRHAHGRPVTIPIHPTLGAALLTDVTNAQTGPVLPMVCEMYQTSRSRVSDELARIFKAANITTSVKIEGRKHKTPEATFHSLRHTFVSFAANAGIPLHFVQAIVGHESTTMTRHYYHEDVEGLRKAVAAIPSFEEGCVACSPVIPAERSRPVSARLKELEALRTAKAISACEYQETRARILSEL